VTETNEKGKRKGISVLEKKGGSNCFSKTRSVFEKKKKKGDKGSALIGIPRVRSYLAPGEGGKGGHPLQKEKEKRKRKSNHVSSTNVFHFLGSEKGESGR